MVLVGVVSLPTEIVPCAVSGDRVFGILSRSALSCASAGADTGGGGHRSGPLGVMQEGTARGNAGGVGYVSRLKLV